MTRKHLPFLLVFTVVLAACGGSPSPEVEPAASVPAPSEPAGSIRDSLGTVEILTSADELGPKPVLRWAPIEGAVEYSLVVRDGDGRVYWAWRGSATEVTFGGGEAGGSASQTAYLHQTMTWTVVAYDASLLPIAMSSEASLTP